MTLKCTGLIPLASTTPWVVSSTLALQFSALGFSRQVSGSEALHMWLLLPGMLFPNNRVVPLSHLGFPEVVFSDPVGPPHFKWQPPSPTPLMSLCPQLLAFLHHVDHCLARGGVSKKPVMLKLQSPSSVGSKARHLN